MDKVEFEIVDGVLKSVELKGKRDKPVTRAPQSYYYVEEVQ